MNLERAIDLLKIGSQGWPTGPSSEEYYTALELGIEALLRIKNQRERSAQARRYLLPSETPGKSTER